MIIHDIVIVLLTANLVLNIQNIIILRKRIHDESDEKKG